MPTRRFTGFWTNAPRYAFDWDGSDDSGLNAFMSGWDSNFQDKGNFEVEHDGSDIFVQWENKAWNATTSLYEFNGTYNHTKIQPGDLIGSAYYWGGSPAGAVVVDISGYWECDEFGRPYDVDDLVSVSSPDDPIVLPEPPSPGPGVGPGDPYVPPIDPPPDYPVRG